MSGITYEDESKTAGGISSNVTYQIRAKDTYFNEFTSSSLAGPVTFTASVPTTPQNFTCTNPSGWGNYPSFSWNTSNLATSYKIERKMNSGSFSQIASVNAPDTTLTDYGVTLAHLGDYDTFYYRIRASNSASNSGYSSEVSITAEQFQKMSAGIPKKYGLYQNYPNPFNPVTEIRYNLPVATQVTLKVYNMLGQEIAVLVNEQKPAGSHTVKWDASNVASGSYIYKIVAGSFTETKQMVVIK